MCHNLKSVNQRRSEALRKIAEAKETATVSELKALAREALKPCHDHKKHGPHWPSTIKPDFE